MMYLGKKDLYRRLIAVSFLCFSTSSFSQIKSNHFISDFNKRKSEFIEVTDGDKMPKKSCYLLDNSNTTEKNKEDIQLITIAQEPQSNTVDFNTEVFNKMLTLDFGAMIVDNKSYFAHLRKDNYTLLATENLIHSTWLFDEHTPYAQRVAQVTKIQNVAEHITNTYGVEKREVEEIIFHSFYEAKNKDIDPILLLSIIGVESSFRKQAKSHAGAVGLTQVMANIHKDKIRKHNTNIWSIDGNIKVGSDIFIEYLELSGGDIPNALQRYNGSLKDKSKKYSKKVLSRYQSYINKYALN